MKYFLFIIAILTGLFGFLVLKTAKSSIHEIESFIIFLISIVAFSGAGIIEAIQKNKKTEETKKNE